MQKKVAELLEKYGQTLCEQAGIKLADRPSPLYQLLVLTSLLSKPISANMAAAAAKELFKAGYRAPQKMREASWQQRVDALGRAHYRRYDESSATLLGEAAELCQERWQDDLRKLHEDAGDKPAELRKRLTEFPGIGPTGADIFLREVQAVWPGVAPFTDRKVRDGAKRLDLSVKDLPNLVDRPDQPRLFAALVRVSRERS